MPGFLMDLLPATISALLADVHRVELTRTVEMASYGQLVHRFGLGASPSDFEARRERGELAGHIGFEESISCLAAALELELEAIEVESPTIDALADEPLPGSGITIQGVEDQHDDVRLESPAGRSIALAMRPSAESVESTACMVANSLRATVEATPGLLAPTDLSAGSIAAPAVQRFDLKHSA